MRIHVSYIAYEGKTREEEKGMAEERKDLDREFQQERKDAHMADATKNKHAWQQKATDAAGRDWTKPRRPQLKDGEV